MHVEATLTRRFNARIQSAARREMRPHFAGAIRVRGNLDAALTSTSHIGCEIAVGKFLMNRAASFELENVFLLLVGLPPICFKL